MCTNSEGAGDRAATIHSRYDAYQNTLFRLEIISDCMNIIQWCSSNFKVCLKWFSHIFNIHVHVFVKVS